MGEMQFSILNSHYQQHKWAGPIYNSYHSPSRASHPSYLPWEPYHVNPESHSSLTEKRYNTLESVLLGEIPASYSHLTTTSSHLSSSPSATSSCSSSSSSPCASSDGSYSASPHPSSSHSPSPLILQNESIQPAATDLSDYQSEPMDLSCKTLISGNGDTVCYTTDRSFVNSAASYSYSPHDNSVTDGSLISSSAGGQTFLSSENFEQTQQCRSPIQQQVIRLHSPEQHQQHPHLHCQQPLLSNRHSPVQRVQCESPMQQVPHQPHQESPLHYQVSSESALHQTFSSVTSQEIQIQRREPNPSCRSPMPFSTQSSQSFSGNSRHSASPSSSAIHLHHTSASTSLESSQSLYDGQSVQSKPQSVHQSDGNSSSVDSHESNRPVQTNHNVSSQVSKTAGHSLLRDLLSCGRNNKSQENQVGSSLPSDNCYSFTASHSSSTSSSISSSSLHKDDNLSSQAKPKEEYVGSKDYSLCSTTRVTLAKKNLLPISARVTEWLYKMVKFAKEIPQFVKLPNNDRLTLILNSWTRLLLMHMAENNFQFAVTPLPFSPDHKTDEAPASNEPTMKSVESVQSFIRKCQSMNLDTSEFEYLRMLVLFNAGYVGLEKSSAVDSMNSHIQQHLQQHIHAKHPSEQIRFSRVLMCLPSLYGINCKMIDNLFCGFIHGKTDIEVLLKDMLQDL